MDLHVDRTLTLFFIGVFIQFIVILHYLFLSAREDRYNHLVSDEDDDDDDDEEIEIGNFSACSPRFSRLLSSSELKDFSNPLKDLEEASSKETSSVEDLTCEDAFPKLDVKVNPADEVDAKEFPIPEIHMNLKAKVQEKCDKSDSGNDSGTQTSSSLDGCASPCLCEGSSGNSTKTFEDADDQDTE